MNLTLVTLFTLISVAFCRNYTRCGTRTPPQWHLKQLKVVDSETNSRLEPIEITTYVHVVTTPSKKTSVTPEMIVTQMQIMNDAYSQIGISFTLGDFDLTVNKQWARSTPMRNMKRSLRKGTYSSLNLYFMSDLKDEDGIPDLLGQCGFPHVDATASIFTLDGCVILADTLPGGNKTAYNHGLTAVHEIGHWFGLFHVFQMDSHFMSRPLLPCTGVGDGDLVDDTPPQSTATRGCPAENTKDSCPNLPGYDSIHNFMDYSSDACMNEFTPGQGDRARAKYREMRLGK
ncbi:uncharacterized protein MYCFIDRAFT_38561 [Pseudocercospora fijiensis CIRAD86]|uniref:Peptidase M43 pregnancy-associated plasma-A domain-containing protein n=1 Tax=Pseudocercospora fijiensis (strain CIRAD86) TaxID=383855 RepID=M2YUD4_PSEFD|nr:uncharacterized protein MYCFIDRAFT_38561 [Pseudocercospora fijiensis CIRAD86]EME81335.1 hypothetical protein MYCFIDRAFT_38561 [Pseudocercospora fijiensis CIRAD86]